MIGRLAVSVLSSLLLVVPHVACADTRKTPVKAPTTTATTKAKPPTPAPTPPPTLTPPTAPATTAVAPSTSSSTCAADPKTELECLRRENDDLRRKINEMIENERSRQTRLTKQLGGGTVINALK